MKIWINVEQGSNGLTGLTVFNPHNPSNLINPGSLRNSPILHQNSH
jgi:hypothetical protein